MGGVELAPVGIISGLAALIGIARLVRVVDGVGVAVGVIAVRLHGRGLLHVLHRRPALFQKAEQPAGFFRTLRLTPRLGLGLRLVLLLILIIRQVFVQIHVLRVEIGVLLSLVGRVVAAPRRQVGEIVVASIVYVQIVDSVKIIHMETHLFL